MRSPDWPIGLGTVVHRKSAKENLQGAGVVGSAHGPKTDKLVMREHNMPMAQRRYWAAPMSLNSLRRTDLMF